MPFLNETRAAIRRDLEEHKLYVDRTVSERLSNLEDNMNRNKDDLGQRVSSVEDHLVDINKKILATQSVVERSLNESMATVNDNIRDYKSQTASDLADLNRSFCGKIDTVSSRMELLNISMREEFRAVERQFQEHKNQTTSELSDLHTSLQSTHTDHLTQICAKMDRINSRTISISSAIDILDSKQDELDIKVISVNSELEQNILTNITKQLKKTSESSYEALGPCGGEGWRRVVYLDMTDPNTTCPSGWQLTRRSKRTCGKNSISGRTCDSVFFPVSAGAYTGVCGRIKGYQYGHTDAFEYYHNGVATTIDEPYVTGVSLTHGSPRQHIWTFAASATSSHTNIEACPCNSTTYNSTPPFVGGDYFCESGANSGSPYGFFLDDPLWDGDSCAVNSTCCPFNNPPYFTKQLSNATTGDLEVRLCRYGSVDDTPIEFMELYIK